MKAGRVGAESLPQVHEQPHTSNSTISISASAQHPDVLHTSQGGKKRCPQRLEVGLPLLLPGMLTIPHCACVCKCPSHQDSKLQEGY